MRTIDLSGVWECSIPGQTGNIRLPGTLDEAGFGAADDPHQQWKADEVKRLGFWQEGDPIVTRFTRRKVFEGLARFSRKLRWDCPAGRRIFLECERTRQLCLLVNGREALPVRPVSLSAPAVFEITGLVSGEDEFVFLSDNSCPGWPRDAIVYASAASDETQTNWNGVLGYVRLRIEEADYISGIRVYPKDGRLEIRVELSLSRPVKGTLRVSSPALQEEAAYLPCLGRR